MDRIKQVSMNILQVYIVLIYLVSATIRSIFGLKSKPLTAREEWAGKLEDELFLDQMRSDAIELLPDIYK
jgi:hypothetical protein